MHKYLNPTQGTTVSASGDRVRVTQTGVEGVAAALKLKSACVQHIPTVLDVIDGKVVSREVAGNPLGKDIPENTLWEFIVQGVTMLHDLKKIGLNHGDIHDVMVDASGLHFQLPLLEPPPTVNEKTDLHDLGEVFKRALGPSLNPPSYPVELCFLIKKLTEPTEDTRPTIAQVLNYHAVKQHLPKDARKVPTTVVISSAAEKEAALKVREEALDKREALLELREAKIEAFLELYHLTAQQLHTIPTTEEHKKLFSDYYGIEGCPMPSDIRSEPGSVFSSILTPADDQESQVAPQPTWARRESCSRELSFHSDQLRSSVAETQAGYSHKTSCDSAVSLHQSTAKGPIVGLMTHSSIQLTDEYSQVKSDTGSTPSAAPSSPLPVAAITRATVDKAEYAALDASKATSTSMTSYTQPTEGSVLRYTVHTEETYAPTETTQSYTQAWTTPPSRSTTFGLASPTPARSVTPPAATPIEVHTPMKSTVMEDIPEEFMMSPQQLLPEVCTPRASPQNGTPKIQTPKTHEEMIAWHLQRSPEKYNTPEKPMLHQCRVNEEGQVVKPWQQRSIKGSLEQTMATLESMAQRNSEGRRSTKRRTASVSSDDRKHCGLVSLTPVRSPQSTPKKSSVRCTSTGRLFATPSTSYYSNKVYTATPKTDKTEHSSHSRSPSAPTPSAPTPSPVPLLNSIFRLPDSEDPGALLKRLRAEKRSINRQS
eukprot:TRINITY_DN1684_c0_g2_i1.p1 TRINITY_DN1684_c0_g2~~TRINITY_DN1684_c0_g2_i1.p1  ORF type:complete len:710 (+),score=140.41 TRINITY_DN1684_c0_g2_i1:667-2796(+)